MANQERCSNHVIAIASGITSSQTTLLPLKAWYPLDPLQPYVYEVLCVHQMLAQMIISAIFASASGISASIIIIMCGQFDILYCSLKNLSYYGYLCVGSDVKRLRAEQAKLLKPTEDEVNQYMYSEEELTDLSRFQDPSKAQKPTLSLTKALHSGVVQCIQLHIFIMGASKEFEQIYNYYCLLKSLQVISQTCLIAFGGAFNELTLALAFNTVQYLFLTISDMFMYTYFAEILGRHSVRCGEAYWRSQWINHYILIRQDILIFLENSKRAIKFTAGNFYEMDIKSLQRRRASKTTKTYRRRSRSVYVQRGRKNLQLRAMFQPLHCNSFGNNVVPTDFVAPNLVEPYF
ncbi:putative odorant receptor 85e [Eurosta solidaginis]|uniref:putative odorant receptor 85e n=1 Tax=Eurosta solidaginis TaxID=178769 RepID=UPI0035313782